MGHLVGHGWGVLLGAHSVPKERLSREDAD